MGFAIGDLTVLYVSASQVPEGWRAFQLQHLLAAVGETAVVSVTRTPLGLGVNLLDTDRKCAWNIYHQMLRAARMAHTPYVGMAEDDTLYTREHFTSFRPPANAVAYDRSRWSLFTWDPVYCLRQRVSNCSLIAPRDYLIDALEERERVWPDGAPDELVGEVGRPIVDRRLNVTPRTAVEWYSTAPIVQMNHQFGMDGGDYGRMSNGRRLVKKHGQIKATDIPVWGRAVELAARFA